MAAFAFIRIDHRYDGAKVIDMAPPAANIRSRSRTVGQHVRFLSPHSRHFDTALPRNYQ